MATRATYVADTVAAATPRREMWQPPHTSAAHWQRIQAVTQPRSSRVIGLKRAVYDFWRGSRAVDHRRRDHNGARAALRLGVDSVELSGRTGTTSGSHTSELYGQPLIGAAGAKDRSTVF